MKPYIDIGFNSMKVRLKHNKPQMSTILLMFQFHEGPIKTTKNSTYRYIKTMFQFHEGPIKTWLLAPYSNNHCRVSIP